MFQDDRYPAPMVQVFCASCGGPEGRHTDNCMAERKSSQPPARMPSQPPPAPSADAARFRLQLAERELENAKKALQEAQAVAREQFKVDLWELCHKYGYTCKEITSERDYYEFEENHTVFGIGYGT